MARSKSRKKNSRAASMELNSQTAKLEMLIQEAESAVDSFNYDEAELKLREILQIDPKNSKSLEMLSGVFIEKFQWQEAQDLLKQCIEIAPEIGYSKYFSMAQLCEGLESVRYFERGIQLIERELENVENIKPSEESNESMLRKNLSDAYCSIAEIFMTDCCFEENAEEQCHRAIDLSIKSDTSNPEAYQCLANFQLIKGQIEEAKESIQKSLTLWLPHHEALQEREPSDSLEKESENIVPAYDSRIKTSKLLIELEMLDEASRILEGLLEEDDEVVEVWYLLGWLNYLQEDDECKKNAHFYFKKAKQVSLKLGTDDDDDYLGHIKELLEELASTHPVSEEEGKDGSENEEENSDFSSDSEEEDQMET